MNTKVHELTYKGISISIYQEAKPNSYQSRNTMFRNMLRYGDTLEECVEATTKELDLRIANPPNTWEELVRQLNSVIYVENYDEWQLSPEAVKLIVTGFVKQNYLGIIKDAHISN